MSDTLELQPNEKIILTLRKHWVVLVNSVAQTLLLGFFSFLCVLTLSVLLHSMLPIPIVLMRMLGVAWLLVTCFGVALRWADYRFDRWILTDRRVIHSDEKRFFKSATLAWSTDGVKEVAVEKNGVFQPYFGYGNVTFHATKFSGDAGGQSESVEMRDVPEPEHVQAILLKQEARYEELEKANQRQTGLLHFLGHETKGYLTKNLAVFASITEGDYGVVPQPLHVTAGAALADTRKGVDTVMSILDTSDFRSGAMRFEMKPFDMNAAVARIAAELRPVAENKKLAFEVVPAGVCIVVGDEPKLERHVIRNLIDNAIRYTPAGSVRVEISRAPDRVRLSVKDSGVGITPEDMQNLFTEGGKGADSSTVNKESTGYGLFVAKAVVGGHGGLIWAESAGKGQGTECIVELPLARPVRP